MYRQESEVTKEGIKGVKNIFLLPKKDDYERKKLIKNKQTNKKTETRSCPDDAVQQEGTFPSWVLHSFPPMCHMQCPRIDHNKH